MPQSTPDPEALLLHIKIIPAGRTQRLWAVQPAAEVALLACDRLAQTTEAAMPGPPNRRVEQQASDSAPLQYAGWCGLAANRAYRQVEGRIPASGDDSEF